MNKKLSHITSLFFVALISLGLLSACNAKKAPEDVLVKTKQALVGLTSGKMTLEAVVKGTGDTSSLDFTGNLTAAFEKDPSTNQRALDISMDFDGAVKSTEKDFDLGFAAQIIAKGSEYYLNLGDFKTTEPSLQLFVPLVDLYKNKWLHLTEDFIPENIAALQMGQENNIKTQQLNDLFVATELFTIKEDKGLENLNGRDTYHLALALNREGFKDYFRGVSAINEVKISEQELEELVTPLDQVKEIEVYVDTEKYYIYKATIVFQNNSTSTDSEVRVNLSFIASDFDQKIEIQIPEDAEEFNPLALPADLGLASSEKTPDTLPLPVILESNPTASETTPFNP